jgi:hypothetical protein
MFEKIKQYFFGGSIEKNGERPKIRIGERHETRSLPPLESAPKIKVRAVHKHSSEADRNAYRAEMNIENQDLGRGIVVKKRRKPGRCPICATQGRVVENTGSGNNWLCEECGSTFN